MKISRNVTIKNEVATSTSVSRTERFRSKCSPGSQKLFKPRKACKVAELCRIVSALRGYDKKFSTIQKCALGFAVAYLLDYVPVLMDENGLMFGLFRPHPQ